MNQHIINHNRHTVGLVTGSLKTPQESPGHFYPNVARGPMPPDNRNRCTQFMTDVTQEAHLHLIIFLILSIIRLKLTAKSPISS